jgi:hypothetical protein
MSTGLSTNHFGVAGAALPAASAVERHARWGRILLWALIANVSFTGVIGPFLLPTDLYVYLATLLGGDYIHQGAVLAQRPWVDMGHRLLGITLLVLGMLQFTPGLRRSHPVLHRWSGRVFLSLVLVVSATALIMGLSYPFGGPTEGIFVMTVSVLLLWFGTNAWRAVRRRRFVEHREWMVRTLGLCFFITVQRLIYIVAAVASGWPDPEIFIMSNWMGVVIVLIAAESWVNLTRTAAAQGSSA